MKREGGGRERKEKKQLRGKKNLENRVIKPRERERKIVLC